MYLAPVPRPLSITIISWLFIATGVIGLVYHSREFSGLDSDAAWVCLVRLVAIVCGAFMLRAQNWARWLLLVWLAYHIILSAFHSLLEFAVHGLLLAVLAWFLFRQKASQYFAGQKKQAN